MVTTQDASIGFATETTYKTGVTPSRWVEYTDESVNWNKNVKQGAGLRVGRRVALSGRRVVTTASGGGDITVPALSKGMGLLWSYCLGAASSTLVSGATYQQLFTLGDSPSSFTMQKGLVEAGGTVDPYTYLGCMVTQWEFDFPNDDIASLKATIDAGDLTTATSYTAPSYASAANLFHFAGGTISTGTLTAPTTTALASAATPVADIRGGSISVNNNLTVDRYNFGGAGRKSKPTTGLREITGSLDVEYDNTTFRDAVLNETPMCIVLTFTTAGALSTGFETLQVVLPEAKFDGQLSQTNGADLIVQSMSFSVLDNLAAAQPIWIATRTSDTAL